jgi:hypothetical protein
MLGVVQSVRSVIKNLSF